MKRYVFLLIALFFVIGVMGETDVSVQEAQEISVSYYSQVRDITKEYCKVGTPERISLLGLAEMWIVPVNDSWILVSTDKRTEAILARFTTQEKPDFKTYPPAAQDLIGGYEYDIAYVRDSCKECPIRSSWINKTQKMISQSQETRSYPSSVEPLLGNIAWRQLTNESYPYADCSKVYNKFCPNINTNMQYLCGHAVAGCVAIAVAQIMRYWEWPYAADVPTTIGGSTKVKKFYDWSLMPSTLSNSSTMAEVDMTAGFIRDIGYDLDMDYGESSGTTDDDALSTFENFGYDENTLNLRAKWKTAGWTNILHSEIAAGRPVYYSGSSSTLCIGGHAFVLDGYDAYDLYHVNLGWGPIDFSNGNTGNYFFIDTITTNNDHHYPYCQAAIWGIKPAARYCTGLTINSTIETPKFCIAQAGQVTISGVNINNVTDGRIYSEQSVRLTTGTRINSGCSVQIAIKPIPCESPIVPHSPAYHTINQGLEDTADGFDISPNYTIEQLEIQSQNKIVTTYVYSIEGKLLLSTNSDNLSTYTLNNGIYVIRAVAENGDVYQSKILLQR